MSPLSQVPGELPQSNYPADGDHSHSWRGVRITKRPACTTHWEHGEQEQPAASLSGPGKPESHVETALPAAAFCTGEHTPSRTFICKEPRVLLFLAHHCCEISTLSLLVFFFSSPLFFLVSSSNCHHSEILLLQSMYAISRANKPRCL